MSKNAKDDINGKMFFNKYKPEKKLGEGSFGKIYSAVNITNSEKVALKMEQKEGCQNLLESEAYFLYYLKGYGIPSVKSYGFSGDYNIMVMELLGKSLEDLFQENKKHFSIKTVCMLADQMIKRIEFIHNMHIIHRDIKPDNFVMGINKTNTIVYLLDFGLAKKYRSSRTLQHIKFNLNKKLTGTARYASINALRGCEQSRRDDLEAIGYVLMYFLRGSLPWQGLRIDKKEDRYKKIYEKKKTTTPEELCAGYPFELVEYVKYTRNLEFEQNPDYPYLRGLFSSIMEKNKHENDLLFDWIKDKSQISQIATMNNNNSIDPKYQDNTNDQLKKKNKNENENEKENNINFDGGLKHLQTFQTTVPSNQPKPKDHERVNTQFANYNTTVEVTNADNNQQKQTNSVPNTTIEITTNPNANVKTNPNAKEVKGNLQNNTHQSKQQQTAHNNNNNHNRPTNNNNVSNANVNATGTINNNNNNSIDEQNNGTNKEKKKKKKDKCIII